MNCSFAQRWCFVGAAAAATLFSPLAWAADPALVQSDKISITAADMRVDAERVPPEMRGLVLTKPENIAQAATNLFIRRAMADKAQAEGLAADPLVAAALQIARDKVLSDALLSKIDKANTLSDAAADGLARNIFRAKPERFNASEEVQIRHILIAAKDENAREKAEKLLAELKSGADFAKMAAERSADPGSAAKGGDLGLFSRGRMVPEFEEASFALQKPGDLSGLVQTQFGYHILQLVARKPAGPRTYEEVRAELLKEVRENVLKDARAAEALKVQQGAKLNEAAVKAFADSFRTGR